jgi:dephospho-CoA kinase
VLDADRVAREVVEPGEPTLAAIVDRFGAGVLDPAGRLDRVAMRARIFADPEARRDLEAITHPAIRARIASALSSLEAQGHPVAVVEAALLVETGSWRQYPGLLVVSCTPDVQWQRLLARDGLTPDQAHAALAAQAPLAEKEAVANAVIWNNGDFEDLRRAVGPAWTRVLATLGVRQDPEGEG